MRSIHELGQGFSWLPNSSFGGTSMEAGPANIFVAQNISIISSKGHYKGREVPPDPGKEEDVFIYYEVQCVVSSGYVA